MNLIHYQIIMTTKLNIIITLLFLPDAASLGSTKRSSSLEPHTSACPSDVFDIPTSSTLSAASVVELVLELSLVCKRLVQLNNKIIILHQTTYTNYNNQNDYLLIKHV